MPDQPSITPDLLHQLTRIADALERLSNNGHPVDPNIIRPIEEYTSFDWSTIGASIVQADPDGPTHVECYGALWTRRSPSNKFDPAIWYSRAHGKDAEGNVQYLRLITFRKIGEADPIPQKAKSGTVTYDVKTYVAEAKRLAVSPEAAQNILVLAGTNIRLAQTRFLPYFSNAKKAGLTYMDAKIKLEEAHGDPEKATASLPKKP